MTLLDQDHRDRRREQEHVHAPATRFRLALIEYAAVHHLAVPRWVHNIGGK
jgi:hypothetical protein